jgi:hypothetical protein
MAGRGATAKALKGGRLSTIAKGGVRGGVEGAASWAGGKALGKIGGMFKGGDAANLAPTATGASGGGADAMVRAAYEKAGVAAPETLGGLAQPSRFRSIAQDFGKAIRPKNFQDTIDLARFAGDTYGNYKEGQYMDEQRGRDRALAAREQADYDLNAPMRAAGRAGMMANEPTHPPVEDVFNGPTPRYRRVAVGSGG